MTHHELQKTIVELRAELVHLDEDNERTKVHVSSTDCYARAASQQSNE